MCKAGLYPKYAALTEGGRGAWFSAHTSDGRVVGLATARLDGSGGCQVDGFAHKYHQSSWEALISSAVDWGVAKGVSLSWASLSVEDEEKQALFASLEFRGARSDDVFNLDSRNVAALRLERVLPTDAQATPTA